MFTVERASIDTYRLMSDNRNLYYGAFICERNWWTYEFHIRIDQSDSPHIFPFILKTLENLNNGVTYA